MPSCFSFNGADLKAVGVKIAFRITVSDNGKETDKLRITVSNNGKETDTVTYYCQ
jgi:hypothetical protein